MNEKHFPRKILKILNRYGMESYSAKDLKPGEIDFLLEELNVYHAELEQQNEELRNLQVSLEMSRNRYYELFYLAPVGYLITDPAGNIQLANSTAINLLQATKNAISGKPLMRFVEYSDHQRLNVFFRHIQADNDYDPLLIHLKQEGGNAPTAVQLDALKLSKSMNNREEILITLTDQTELMAAQRNLENSERLHRSLIDSSQDHIYMLSTEGIFLTSNDQVAHPGYSRGQELIGKSVGDLMSDSESEIFIQKLQEVLHTKKPVLFEHEVTCAETTYSHSGCFYPIFEGDTICAIGGMCRDISEMKAAIKEREEFERRLSQAQKLESIGTLAAGIAHDFNNILAVIIGFTELSVELAEPESELNENLKEVLNAGDRAKNLVRQILSFARKNDHTLEPIQVDKIVKETGRFLSSVIPRTIAIETNIDSSGMVLADAVQLHQVIMNLCTNAAQAIGAQKGRIQIDLSEINLPENQKDSTQPKPSQSLIDLQISDDGCGIPEEIIDKIFDPYFTTKKQGEGSGMGLSVVHGIITSFGGTIEVRSQIGQGSVFRITLPIAKESVPAATIIADGVGSETLHGSGRIMIVDDEEAILRAYQRILENVGYDVFPFSSSENALQCFAEEPQAWDLLITDMTMPALDGAKLAQEVLKFRPGFPIILSTGYSSFINNEESRALGIMQYLDKPVNPKVLVAAVHRLLNKGQNCDTIHLQN